MGFFFFPAREQSCLPEEELVGMMALQESHPRGEGCKGLALALQADLGGDRYKTSATIGTGVI